VYKEERDIVEKPDLSHEEARGMLGEKRPRLQLLEESTLSRFG
jgi:hypothetical protein